MHHIEPGPASKSYGIAVAKLAGVPAAVVNHAKSALNALETQQTRGARAGRSVCRADPKPQEAEQSALDKALHQIDPDALSPREALDALYQLKKLINRA